MEGRIATFSKMVGINDDKEEIVKRVTSLITAIFLMTILPVISYGQWNIETVDTNGAVGTKCAIAVDANGYPHISYRDGTIGWRLKYAQWDGSNWQIVFVETTQSVYGATSIALDSAGNPHIAFEKGFSYGGQLWHAWWDGSNWQQEGLDSLPFNGDVGEWNSIAFDTYGYPHIAYTYYTYADDCYLKYAYKDASGWHIQVVDSLIGTEFQYVSLALDADNNPHISYHDYSVYDLKYARLETTTGDTLLWTKTYGGSEEDRVYGVQRLSNGSGYLVCGFTRSFSAGNQDLWILKINEQGDTLWTYTYGGWGNDRTYDDMQRTSDNGFIIHGTTHSFSPDGTHAMWLVKLDSLGNIEWDKSFSTGQPYDYGENGQAIETFDKGYILAGVSYSSGHTTALGFVVKTDSMGNEMWRKTYGNPDSITVFNDLVQLPDSGFIFVGETNSYGNGKKDFFIVRTNSIGDTLWSRVYGGSEHDNAFLIQKLQDGNYLLIGNSQSFGGIWVLKMDSNGDTLWTKIYDYWYIGGVSGISATQDSNYILTGSCRISSTDSTDILMIKITPTGDTLWTATFGSDEDNVYGASSIEIEKDKFITVGGIISSGNSDAYALSFRRAEPFWHTEIVDSTGNVGEYSSIALDSFDYPHIAYMDYTNYGVKYARWDGSTWQIETVESNVGYGFYTSLALDANDRPYISSAEYLDDLRFAWWDGSNWQIEVVDTTVWCGWTSLAIDDNGYCHIAYFNDDPDGYALKYAKRIATVGVEETAFHTGPEGFHLAQNYPNPFNAQTSIQYTLPRNSFVRLSVYNILGQFVCTLVNGEKSAGTHTVIWDGRDEHGISVSSGIYFYCLEIGNFKRTRKLLFLK